MPVYCILGMQVVIMRRAVHFIFLLLGVSAALSTRAGNVTHNDYNGDGAADLAVYQPSLGRWYIVSTGGTRIANPIQWGYPTAVPVPADYNGDGRADMAVYDRNGGYWYIKSVATSFFVWRLQWGWTTAVPVPGDYDGDNVADVGVYDLNTALWYVYSVKKKKVLLWASKWGFKGDVRTWEKRPYPSTVLPMPFDYDQDGKTDQGFYYRGTNMQSSVWSIKGSSGLQILNKAWGSSGSIGAPGFYIQHYSAFDYPPGISTYKIGSTTATPEWGTPYVIGSQPGYGIFMGQFGKTLPVPGMDMDGNGWDDYVLYDYSTGDWTIKYSTGDGNSLRYGSVVKIRHGFAGVVPANIYSTIYHSCNYSPAPW